MVKVAGYAAECLRDDWAAERATRASGQSRWSARQWSRRAHWRPATSSAPGRGDQVAG